MQQNLDANEEEDSDEDFKRACAESAWMAEQEEKDIR